MTSNTRVLAKVVSVTPSDLAVQPLQRGVSHAARRAPRGASRRVDVTTVALQGAADASSAAPGSSPPPRPHEWPGLIAWRAKGRDLRLRWGPPAPDTGAPLALPPQEAATLETAMALVRASAAASASEAAGPAPALALPQPPPPPPQQHHTQPPKTQEPHPCDRGPSATPGCPPIASPGGDPGSIPGSSHPVLTPGSLVEAGLLVLRTACPSAKAALTHAAWGAYLEGRLPLRPRQHQQHWPHTKHQHQHQPHEPPPPQQQQQQQNRHHQQQQQQQRAPLLGVAAASVAAAAAAAPPPPPSSPQAAEPPGAAAHRGTGSAADSGAAPRAPSRPREGAHGGHGPQAQEHRRRPQQQQKQEEQQELAQRREQGQLQEPEQRREQRHGRERERERELVQLLPDHPARPARPRLVRPKEIPGHESSPLGLNGYMLHNLAHIELNAIDLAWDTVVRFAPLNLPDQFYEDFARVADDESRHLGWCLQRLGELGHVYGDMDAHDLLWQGCRLSAVDLGARLAVVPMSQEARGLDAGGRLVGRLVGFGDSRSAAVVAMIAEEERAHVAVGVTWFSRLCGVLGVRPDRLYRQWLLHLNPDLLKGPFNHSERSRVGLPRDWYDPTAWPSDPLQLDQQQQVPEPALEERHQAAAAAAVAGGQQQQQQQVQARESGSGPSAAVSSPASSAPGESARVGGGRQPQPQQQPRQEPPEQRSRRPTRGSPHPRLEGPQPRLTPDQLRQLAERLAVFSGLEERGEAAPEAEAEPAPVPNPHPPAFADPAAAAAAATAAAAAAPVQAPAQAPALALSR